MGAAPTENWFDRPMRWAQLTLVENDPMLLHLAVADLCWRLELDDLGRHRPRRGDQAARDTWLAGQEVLEAEGRRLAAKLADTIGTL